MKIHASHLLLILSVFSWPMVPWSALADTNSPPAAGPALMHTKIEDLLIGAANDPRLTNILHDVTQPDLLNGLADRLRYSIISENTNAYLQFLKDFNLNFKMFDADTAGGEAALGFDYSYERSVLGRTVRPESDNPIGLSFSVHAKGNVAFDQAKNPDNFLDTGLKFHVFQSLGGWQPTITQAVPPDDEKTEAQKLIDKLPVELTLEQRRTNQQWQEFFRFIDDRSYPQFFWDAAGNVALESNQSFSKKQMAYGLQWGAVLRAWNSNSKLAKWNILDFPFAAVRYVTHADEDWRPSGQALPSVLAGIDLVDPLQDAVRFGVDPDKDPYPRLRAEVGFKTRLTRLKQQDLWLSLSYRYFREIGASSAIRSAKLDEFSYFAANLDLIYGLNFTFSTGRLPLDLESDRVFALGWKLNF